MYYDESYSFESSQQDTNVRGGRLVR